MILGLAPMDGITDGAYRYITKRIFDTYNKKPENELWLWTEFMNVNGYLINPSKVLRHMLTISTKAPTIAQIYGGNEDRLLEAVLQIEKDYSDTFSGLLGSAIFRYSKSKVNLNISKNIDIKIEYSHLLTPKTPINNPKATLISSLNFTDKYFDDELQISATVLHKYSDFYIAKDNRQIINDLGMNLRVKIIDVEIFFGIDNIVKNKYDINNNKYILNEHYDYQTIEGYDMQRVDEIWGVRWIFRY